MGYLWCHFAVLNSGGSLISCVAVMKGYQVILYTQAFHKWNLHVFRNGSKRLVSMSCPSETVFLTQAGLLISIRKDGHACWYLLLDYLELEREEHRRKWDTSG